MSFLFDRKKGKNIPPNATFRLTQSGKEKLQDFGGDPKSRILMALETRGTSDGTSDISEISQASGLSKGQVERLVPAMIRGSYVQYVSSSTEENM